MLAGTLLVALALSGCLSGGADNSFGPEGSDDGGTATGVNEAGNGLALVFKASPAAGEAPLEVELTLRASGAPAAVAWAIDFGDGSAPERGTGLPAEVSHTYRKEGVMTVTASVGEGATASKAILSLLVRPESQDEESTSSTSTTTQPPFQPPPPPPPPSETTSSTTTTTDASSSSTTSSESSTSTTSPPTNSSTTTTSETTTSTSETTTTTAETTTSTSETTTTTSESTTSTSESTTTTSESQTQTTTSANSTTTEPQA